MKNFSWKQTIGLILLAALVIAGGWYVYRQRSGADVAGGAFEYVDPLIKNGYKIIPNQASVAMIAVDSYDSQGAISRDAYFVKVGNLRFMQSTATKLYAAGIRDWNVAALSGDNANKINIKTVLNKIAQASDSFVYIIGATSRFENDGVQLSDKEKLTFSEINQWLSGQAKSQVIFLIGNYSGRAISVLEGNNRIVITSSKEDKADYLLYPGDDASYLSYIKEDNVTFPAPQAFRDVFTGDKNWKTLFSDMIALHKKLQPWMEEGYPSNLENPMPQFNDKGGIASTKKPSDIANAVFNPTIEDTTPPTITHTPITKHDVKNDLTLTATVTGVRAEDKVFAYFLNEWGGWFDSEMKRKDGNNYELYIKKTFFDNFKNAGLATKAGVMEYYIAVIDKNVKILASNPEGAPGPTSHLTHKVSLEGFPAISTNTAPTVTINSKRRLRSWRITGWKFRLVADWTGSDKEDKTGLVYRRRVDNGNWSAWESATSVDTGYTLTGADHTVTVQVKDKGGLTAEATK